MTKTTSKSKAQRAPLCLRLSEEERAQLRELADKTGLNVSAYIRERLFADDTPHDLLPHETRQKLLAQILAELGNAGYAKSFSEIVEAAHAGLLPLNSELTHELKETRTQLQKLHQSLLRTLGLRP